MQQNSSPPLAHNQENVGVSSNFKALSLEQKSKSPPIKIRKTPFACVHCTDSRYLMCPCSQAPSSRQRLETCSLCSGNRLRKCFICSV